MSQSLSASVHGSSSPEMNGWLVVAASLLTVAFIGLTIYVDVITGLGNAVTPHEKDVMRFLGFILGSFASISVILTAILLQNGDYFKAALAGILAAFLNIYHFSVWIAFFAGIGTHYSKVEVESSIAYKAQQAALEILTDSKPVEFEAKTVDSSRIIELKNTITNEKVALKKCSQTDGWRKVRDCKIEHNQALELANNELTVLTAAQKSQADTIKHQADRVAALQDLESKSKNSEKVLLPLFDTISDNTEEGLKYQRYFGYLLALIAILITDGGFFLVRGLSNKRLSFANFVPKEVKTPAEDEAQKATKSKQPSVTAKESAYEADSGAKKADLLELFKTNYATRTTSIPKTSLKAKAVS